jgi:hypothetical protein
VPFASVGATCTANSNAQASTVCKLNADSSGCATADSGCTYEAMPTSDNNWVQTIALGTLDLNILKRMNDLATKEDGSDTFVAITTSFIDDMYGNEVTQIDETSTNQLLPVTKYEFDLTDPKLVSFCFNMHDGELIMTFDETVDSANLVVAELTMQTSSDHGGIFTDHLDLDSDFNTKFTTESNTVVTVSLNSHDMNLMKINQNGITSRANTFLSMTPLAVTDMTLPEGNKVEVVEGSDAMQEEDCHTPDDKNPTLLSFTFDFDAFKLQLTFDETIEMNGGLFEFPVVDPNLHITFYENADGTGESYPLKGQGGARVLKVDAVCVLEIDVLKTDMDEIKKLSQLAVSEESTYMAITPALLKDMNDNPVNEIFPSAPKAVSDSGYNKDQITPKLESYTLNMNDERLFLTFSETVNPASLAIPAITIQAAQGSTLLKRVLTVDSPASSDPAYSQVLTTGPEVVIEVLLGKNDMNNLKLQVGLADSHTSTYLFMGLGAILDMASLPVDEILASQAMKVDSGDYIQDDVDPNLISFDLDLTAETLTLNFDETVNSASLNPDQITFQNQLVHGSGVTSYKLTGDKSRTGDGTSVIVTLLRTDVDAIKALPDLAIVLDFDASHMGSGSGDDTSDASTFLVLPNTCITDQDGNEVVPHKSNNALEVSTYKEDALQPELSSFDLNMNTGILVLSFTETVNINTMNIGTLKIHSQADFHVLGQPTTDHTTTFGSATTFIGPNPFTPVAKFQLSDADMNEIKKRDGLADAQSTTFIEITTSTVMDMNNHNVKATSMPVNVAGIAFDTTDPVVEAFDVDLTAETITLFFSEAVRLSDLDVTKLVLQSTKTSNQVEKRLTTVDHVPDVPSNQLNNIANTRFTFKLDSANTDDSDDLNFVKKTRDLFVDESTSFVRVAPGFIKDMQGNAIDEIFSGNALKVRAGGFTADATDPALLEFDLNMNSKTLTLRFSETVKAIDSLTENSLTAFTLIGFSSLTSKPEES